MSDPIYKIGDTVRLKASHGETKCGGDCATMNDTMYDDYASMGIRAQIASMRGYKMYAIDVDGEEWTWSECMIEDNRAYDPNAIEIE